MFEQDKLEIKKKFEDDMLFLNEKQSFDRYNSTNRFNIKTDNYIFQFIVLFFSFTFVFFLSFKLMHTLFSDKELYVFVFSLLLEFFLFLFSIVILIFTNQRKITSKKRSVKDLNDKNLIEIVTQIDLLLDDLIRDKAKLENNNLTNEKINEANFVLENALNGFRKLNKNQEEAEQIQAKIRIRQFKTDLDNKTTILSEVLRKYTRGEQYMERINTLFNLVNKKYKITEEKEEGESS